jgi:glucose/arabinose dehydrogenase
MGRSVTLALVAVVCASGSLAAQTLTDTRLKVSTWASGLSNPTTFTWIGPGEMLVIQKNDGKVKWIKDGVVQGTALDVDVCNTSERGGLGIAADPDFATNSHVFVYFSSTSATGDSSSSSTWVDNRVMRYDWNGSALVNGFGPIVAFPMDVAQSNGDNHDGGVIKFGPDGKLYGVTGDLNRGRFGGMERVEQNTAASGSAGVGGMFRLETDGSIPSDNPFVGETDTSFHLWWSYGLRNSFGLTFDALNGNVWYTENGPDKYDEVNRCPFGMNGGWLKIMGPDSRDAKYAENGNTKYDAKDLVYLQNAVYVDPEFSFKTPIGITGVSFLHTKRFPDDLRDQLVWGDVNTNQVYLATMKANRLGFSLPAGLTDKVADTSAERDKLKWGANWAGATDIQIGSDGYVYVVGYSAGKIYRIRPVTDFVEAASFTLAPNMLTKGSPSDADTSNDKYYGITEKGIVPGMTKFGVEATFALNQSNPNTVVLELENHYNQDMIKQDVYAWNIATQTWDLLDEAGMSVDDVYRALTLATPTNYVDATTLEVKVRIAAEIMTGPNKPLVTSHPNPWLTLLLDELRLDVTYP